MIVVGLVLAAPTALAGHGGDPITIHRTYEVGFTYAGVHCVPGYATVDCDPTGQTQDGSIDASVVWYEKAAGDLPAGVDAVQASVIDDIFGPGIIGGHICTDEGGDGNDICGEAHETNEAFCGQSSVVDIPRIWQAVGVFLGGPVRQTLSCDPTQGIATSGGVLNPAGGVYLIFE